MSEFLEGYLIPALVFFFGGYFIIKTGGLFLKHPKKFAKALSYKGDGDASALRSLGVALAGTLGVGNIVGVVGAIGLGGAGAIFWMWISSFFAMMLKYAETVVAMKNRFFSHNGIHGGGMYYVSPKPLAVIFAILCLACSFVLGGAIQSEALAHCAKTVLGIDGNAVCIIMAILCAVVICLGKRGIFTLASRIVPFMSILYALMCIAVIALGRHKLPSVFHDIINGAFTPSAVAGGGVFAAIKYGILRGLISNEAGCGSAPIAHAACDNPSPACQGCLGIVEVFIDTVVLCTLTGLAILIFPSSYNGIGAVLWSFEVVFGDISSYLLTVAVALFAFATQICWAFYGSECILYLFPRSKKAGLIYRILFCLCIFGLRFIGEEGLWLLADLIIALMALINLFGLFRHRHEVIKETRLFFS